MIDPSLELTDARGEPFTDEAKKSYTLGDICINALSMGLPKDQGEEGKEKIRRFRLSCAIADAEAKNEDLELVSEDLVMLKDRIAAGYINAALVGRCWDLLEPPK